ncbi:MAG: Sec translocon accessory complex subunit YajC [Calditrichaeota bacterium]|nr:Sec translocon accessory complex subunit YajC [Calditrichota bacterium]
MLMHMLFTLVLLMGGGGGGEGEQGSGGLMSFLPFILIFVIIYFLMIRPQAKRQKEQRKMIQELKQGDEIVTIGGLHGTIAGIRDQDNTLIVKLNEGNKVIVDRSAVNRKVQAG